MNNSKCKILLLSLTLLMLAGLMLLASCGGSKVTGIAIKSSDMPRASYVQGQDLDLSGGVITAIVSGKETAVPMTAEGVSVSGYNRDTLGKQTVTVTYEGQSTTFEVTVVARMVADGHKNEYFVKDTLDPTQGKLKITKDDGTVFTVALNSEFVTLTYDFSQAGNIPVSVTYDDGAGTHYEATFSVTVYPIGEVTFTKPSKTVYSSHETELSLAGGYFTVKAEGSSLSTYVNLTETMYDGFKPWEVTSEYRDTPCEQTVIFTYAGQTFEFKISILYSGVSIVKDAATALADVTITDETTLIPAALGEIALDAAKEYFKLTQARKDLIPKEDAEKVIAVAAVYTQQVFYETALTFSDTFVISETTGNISLVTKYYQTTKDDLARYNSKDDPFNVYVELLHKIQEDFDDLVIYGETTVEDYLKVPSAEELSFYSSVFSFMINVYDSLAEFTKPAPWTKDDLAPFATDIASALKKITSSIYIGPNFNYVYNSISSWRENNDYYEIIFTYYLYFAESEEDQQDFLSAISNSSGLAIPLPGDLQTWYSYISQGASQLNHMGTYADSTAYLYDTTRFMYSYYKTLELAEQIKNGDNQLYIDIYNFIGGDSLIHSYLEHSHSLGYLYHSATMLDSTAYKKLWDSYIELASIYYENKITETTITGEHKVYFNAVLNDLAALSPAELYGFLCSLSFRYNESRGHALLFDYTGGSTSNVFVFLMANYGSANLSEEAKSSFALMLAAMEKYALIGIRENALSEFKESMQTLMQNYDAMSAQDRASFDEMMGACYTKYVTIYNACGSTTTPNNLGKSEADYLELKSVLEAFLNMSNIFNDSELTDEQKQAYYPLVFALCEKAQMLYANLVEDGTTEAQIALFSVYYPINGVNMTLDQAYSLTRDFFANNLIYKTISIGTAESSTQILFWVLYEDSALRPFMASISELMLAYVNETAIDSDMVYQILLDFRAMTAMEQSMFYMFGFQMYYDSLLSFFNQTSGDNTAFIQAVLQAEIGYITYLLDPTEAGRVTFFQNTMTSAIAAYEAVTNKEELHEYLVELYEFYLAKYNEIKNS